MNGLLLGLAAVCLAAAAWRLVSRVAPDGLERPLAAIVVAVAVAGAEALVLGWLGLGMEPVLLTLAAVATWVGVRLTLPEPGVSLPEELRGWWSALRPWERVAVGALAGASLAAAAAWVRRPGLGYDNFLYHLPIAVSWVQEGNPGEVNEITGALPLGAYPAFDELMLAWSAAISKSLVPFSLWPVLLLAVTACGGWVGLRSLAVPRPAAALATTAVVVSQQVAGWQATGASTDPASLAWLVASGGLCAASLGRGERPARPALLAPALLAGALAVGTKPTAAPLGLLVLGVAAYSHRAELRTVARPLALAAGLGVLVGGWWYFRNTALYNSPLYPFYSGPGGDPLPAAAGSAPTFLEAASNTVDIVGTRYLEAFGGGLLLIVAAILAPLLDRRRLVLGGAAATAVALLAWMNTPNTGVEQPSAPPVLVDGLVSTTRYLVAGVAAAALTVALVTRRPGAPRAIAYAVLGAAAAISVKQFLDLGQPAIPSPALVCAGAVLGGLAALALGAGRLPVPALSRGAAAAAAAALAVGLGGLGLAALTPGQFDRIAAAQPEGGLLRWFAAQPEFDEGSQPITTVSLRQSVLAGAGLDHRVDLAVRPRCAELRRRASEGWVVLWGARSFFGARGPGYDSLRCFAGRRAVHRDALHDVFSERR